MIMGINDHCPMYPTLSWDKNFGKGAGGWFVTDVDAGAEWVSLYLDNYLAKSKDDIGDVITSYSIHYTKLYDRQPNGPLFTNNEAPPLPCAWGWPAKESTGLP